MRTSTFIAASVAALLSSGAASAQETPERHWSFDGIFGTFDRGALQRGFQVYNDVCSTCHSMRQLYYRNLMEIGLTEEQVFLFPPASAHRFRQGHRAARRVGLGFMAGPGPAHGLS